MNEEIVVHKLDEKGIEVWRYSGRLLEKTDTIIILEARYDRGDQDFHGLTLRKGDRWAIIVIPSGFQEAMATGETDVEVYYNATNLAAAMASRSTVQSIIEGINRSLADSEPLVTIRFEGRTRDALDEIIARVLAAAPELRDPVERRLRELGTR